VFHEKPHTILDVNLVLISQVTVLFTFRAQNPDSAVIKLNERREIDFWQNQ